MRSIGDARRKNFPDDWRTYSTLAELGQVLTALGRYGEAEPLLTTAYRELSLRAQSIPHNQKRVLQGTSDAIDKLHALQRQKQSL